MIARVEGDRSQIHLGHELVPFSTEGTGHFTALLEVAARPVVVAFGLCDEPEHRMAGKRYCSFAAVFGGLEAECGELAGTNQVALGPGDPGTAAVGVSPKPRRYSGAARDSLLESRASLYEIAAQPPEAPESNDEPYFRLGVVGEVGVVERGPDVVLLFVEDVQPTTLLGAAKVSGFHELQEIPSVTVRNASQVVCKEFECVLAHRLEHLEPG